MKKNIVFVALATLSLLLVSCKKDDFGGVVSDQDRLIEDTDKIVNTFTTPACSDTRMTYEYADNEGTWNVTKTWEVGDVLVGVIDEKIPDTDSLMYFTYKCTEISGGVATWTRVAERKSSYPNTPAKGYKGHLYMVFGKGSDARKISDGGDITYATSITSQTEGKPQCIACGVGTLDENDKLDITFENKMALLVLNDLTLAGATSGKVSELKVEGVNVNAKFEVKDGDIVFTPTGKADGKRITLNPATADKWAVNSEGKFSSDPLIVAVPTGTNLNEVVVRAILDDESEYTYAVTKDATIDPVLYRIKNKSLSPYYVAQIGEKTYMKLAEAIADANNAESDVTVKVINNAYSPDSLIINNANAKVTIDLNGKSVDSKIAVASVAELIDGAADGVLTYTGSEKYGCPVHVLAGGKFTMTSGTINALGTSEFDSGIRARGLDGNNATVTLKGGTITSQSAYGAVYGYRTIITSQNMKFVSPRSFFVTTSSNLTVNSGEYTYLPTTGTKYSCIHSGASTVVIVLNDGTFTAGTAMFSYYNNTAANGDVTIKGGKYLWDSETNFAPNANSKLKPQGGIYSQDISTFIQGQYACVANSDPVYKYKVEASTDNSILQVGTTKYETVAAAMEAVNGATSAVTIKVLKNIDLGADDSLVFTNSVANVTLDLNNFTIKSTHVSAPVVAKAKNLTITSTTTSGTISQYFANNSCALHVACGICNVTGGTIIHNNGLGYSKRMAIVVDGIDGEATLNVSGGQILAGGRVITFGSGNSSKKCYVNISGGLIKARLTSKENSTGKISYVNSADFSMVGTKAAYGYLTITGGTFYAYYQPILYTNYNNTTITIKRDGDSVPYFFQKYPDWTGTAGGAEQTGRIFKAYSATTGRYYSVQECYTNAVNVSHAEILTTYGSVAHKVSPAVKDSYGNSYDNHFYKDPEE